MSEEDWAKARAVQELRVKEWEEVRVNKEVEEETGVSANAI